MNIENYIQNKLNINKDNYKSIIKLYLFDNDNNKAIINLNIKNAHFLNIKTPEWQRETYNDKITDIINFQIKTYEKTNKFMFINNIVIDYCIEDDTFYLIDGQHRYNAAIELDKSYDVHINIWFEFILSRDLTEVKEHFDLINKHTLQPENVSDITKKIFNYYQNKYIKIFKSTQTTKKPYIQSNAFERAVTYLIDELNKKYNREHSIEEIKTIINNKNDKCSKYTLDKWKKIKDLKNLKSIIDIADENKFYLGIYTQSKKDYTYKWILEILENNEIKNEFQNPVKKKKIPPMKKQQVWDYWKCGVNKSKCHCCRIATIYYNSYHCGHVIAESNGGTLDIENLRPICQSCNSSMNNKNMIDYMNINYKENLSHFYSKN